MHVIKTWNKIEFEWNTGEPIEEKNFWNAVHAGKLSDRAHPLPSPKLSCYREKPLNESRGAFSQSTHLARPHRAHTQDKPHEYKWMWKGLYLWHIPY